jgi:hypothetical protein
MNKLFDSMIVAGVFMLLICVSFLYDGIFGLVMLYFSFVLCIYLED